MQKLKTIIMALLTIVVAIIFFLIIVTGLALLFLFINGKAIEYLYTRTLASEGIFILINNGFLYLLLFMGIFIFVLVTLYLEMKSRKTMKKGSFRNFKIFAMGGTIIILLLGYVNLKSFDLLYEDRFIVHRLFRDSREYRIGDINYFIVEMPSKRYNDLKIRAYGKDGQKIDLIGGAEYFSDKFEEKYDSYEFQVWLNDLFLENGIRKEVRDRERILKESNDYDEPYRSYIRRLVEN